MAGPAGLPKCPAPAAGTPPTAPAGPPDAKPSGYLAGGPVARRGEVDQRAELRDGVGEAALERVGGRARRSRGAVAAAAAAEVNREGKKYAAVSRYRELGLPIEWAWAAVPIGTGSNSNGPKYIKTNGPISS